MSWSRGHSASWRVHATASSKLRSSISLAAAMLRCLTRSGRAFGVASVSICERQMSCREAR